MSKIIVVAPVLSTLSLSEMGRLNGSTMTEQELEDWLAEAARKNKGLSLLSVENFIDKINNAGARGYFFACVTIKDD